MLKTEWYFCLVLGIVYGWISGLGQVTLAQDELPTQPAPQRSISLQWIERYRLLQAENSEQLEEANLATELLQAQIQKMGEFLQAEGVSEAAYPEILTQLQVQRINLSIELAGLDAKSKHLQAMLSKPPGETQDATLVKRRQMLEEILSLEQRELKGLQELEKAGAVSSRQVSELRKRVMGVEVQLLELESPSSTRTPETIWAGDVLAKVAMDRIEVAAKLAKIDELLVPQQRVRSMLSEIEQLRSKLSEMRVKQSYLQKRQFDLEDRSSQLQLELQTPPSPLK